MAEGDRLITILIPAVGGQGGGVLSEWIVDAALLEGLQTQSTSIPGVAQRTGSTSYLVEVLDRRHAADGDGREPVFSLFPVPGALDVLLAPEFLEVGRAIEAGFPSPARTTIVASTHRLYSIHEKTTTAGSIYPSERLEAAARRFSRRLVGFDALALARAHGTEANAVLLGALAAADALPISPASFRAAIERKGVQVEANLKGFDAGYAVVLQPVPVSPPRAPVAVDPAFGPDVASYPDALQPTIAAALARLVDYQDRAYANRFLARVDPIVAAEREPYTLSAVVARHLAVWMTYEDAIRVADLKTRAARFRRIRAGARPGTEIVVTDYLKPDLDELYGILPYRLVRRFAAWAERRWPHGRPTLGQHVRTTTVAGFLRVWLLAKLRLLRPISYRAHHEHALMEEWLETIARCAHVDHELACEVARAAQLVKGYGEVRRRMTAAFRSLLDAVRSAAALDVPVARALAARYRTLALQGPDGEAAAAAEAARVLDELRSRPAAVTSAAR